VFFPHILHTANLWHSTINPQVEHMNLVNAATKTKSQPQQIQEHCHEKGGAHRAETNSIVTS